MRTKNNRLNAKVKLILLSFSVIALLLYSALPSYSQGVSINTSGNVADPSAALDIQSNNQGLLIPRMTTAERNSIVNPAAGLQIYNTTTKCFEFYEYGLWQIFHCAVCPLPDAAGTISGTASVCTGDNNVVYNVAAINNATIYNWNYTGSGTVLTGSSNSISINFSSSATSGILTVAGSNNCGNGSVSLDFPITINPLLPVSISISASVNPINPGQNVLFTASPVNEGSVPVYQWKINGVNAGSNSNTFSSNTLSDGDEVICELLSNAPCATGNPAVSNTIVVSVNAQPGLSIGDFYEGGYIFYIDAGGCSGLVCAPNDQSSSEWGWEDNYGGTSTAVGTGQANTLIMTTNHTWYSMGAAYICDNLTEGGYTDWFLPSRDELVLMYNELTAINVGNLSGNYWSSSENYSWDAYYVDMNSGSFNTGYKMNYNNVRAVRAFNSPPAAGTHNVSLTEIEWNWNPAPGAAGYKYNSIADYATAVSNGTNTSYTQIGLTCGTNYNLYVWADFGCANPANAYTTLSAQTTPAPSPPVSAIHIQTLNEITWKWMIDPLASGYKYNTSDDYASAIDNGTDTSFAQSGLNCGIQYTLYVWAYNACGVSPSSALIIKTLCCDIGQDVQFTYKGQQVTYKIVGGQNGVCWMDRNLGASAIATSGVHSAAYGDYFQWGRLDDGHQTSTSATTTTLSSSPVPGHALFIKGSYPPNWYNGANPNDLWQGTPLVNNPCPSGWRPPTQAEWLVEVSGWSEPNYVGAMAAPLKLPYGGYRSSHTSASFYNLNDWGMYWSTTTDGNTMAYTMRFAAYPNNYVHYGGMERSNGMSIRCLREN